MQQLCGLRQRCLNSNTLFPDHLHVFTFLSWHVRTKQALLFDHPS